ncbi:MAG TPA: peptidoglycan bridge formation glycyltransferase FemA/FemB family protein [Armatimonadota bacterium]|jgi:lipid II:glycine glycyltransferase (peptidoglycan interpeptide bridge formation enzyme)
MRTVVCSSADRERWNSFAAWAPGADLLQSFEWGELKAGSGWRPHYIAIEEHGELQASAMVLRRALPLPGKSILYAPRGPLLKRWELPLLKALVSALREVATKEGAVLLKVDPALTDPQAATLLSEAGFRTASGASGFGGTQPRCVMTLDLRKTPEELLEGFKPKWRYNIRLAERKGVTVRQGASPGDLRAFYQLLEVTAARDEFLVRSFQYFLDMWDLLGERQMAKLFLAEVEGEPVSGALCFLFGDTCWYTYGASANAHREKMPNHLMQWTMMRWAQDHGYHVYDFRGVSPRAAPDAEDKLGGLNRFKAGFGAEFVEYIGEFDLPLSPLLYPLWVRGLPFAKRLLRGRRRAHAPAPADQMG